MRQITAPQRALLLGTYLAVVAAATLLWAPSAAGLSFAERLQAMLHPRLAGSDVIDGIRNVALFSGWGLLWMLTAHRDWSARKTLVLAVTSGAVCSLLVELAQLFFTTRTPSLLDVGTNTLGAGLGAVITGAFLHWLGSHKGRQSFVGIPAALFALSYGGTVVGETLVPLFRQALRADAWGSPARRWTVAWAQFQADSGWFPLPIGDILLFAPLGVLAVAALAEQGWRYPRAVRTVAILGVAASFALEFAHGLLGIQIRLGAATTHGIAIALGAGVAGLLIPRFSQRARGAARPRRVLVAYGIIASLWLLRPYRLDLSGVSLRMKWAFPWWVPLGDARYRADLFPVIDVLGGFLLFLPVGALLAVWPLRKRGVLAGIWPASLLALVLEASQFLIAGRTPTVTDPLVQTAAAAIGWFAVRKVGYPRYGTVLSD